MCWWLRKITLDSGASGGRGGVTNGDQASYDNMILLAALILLKFNSFYSALANAFFCFFVNCAVVFGGSCVRLLVPDGGVIMVLMEVELIVIVVLKSDGNSQILEFSKCTVSTNCT